jgi:molecular chaperone Hsp33
MLNSTLPLEFPDEVQSFSVENTNVRGRLVRLGKAYENILNNHDYPTQVAGLIGELTVMSISLADSLKYDGQFILQTQSSGPINMMVANVTSGGTIRSYARYDAEKFNKTIKQNSVPHLLGNGHIAFTVDQGADTERYQGITALEGSNLAKCAQNYFRQSEQIETAIILTANPVKKKAAALMIQKMPVSNIYANQPNTRSPEEDDESWRSAVVLMSSIETEELLDTNLKTNELLFRLYHESGVRLYNKKSLKFQCHCSSKKLAQILASFPEKEIEDMKTDEGLITSNCEFCGTDYKFDDKILKALRNNEAQ